MNIKKKNFCFLLVFFVFYLNGLWYVRAEASQRTSDIQLHRQKIKSNLGLGIEDGNAIINFIEKKLEKHYQELESEDYFKTTSDTKLVNEKVNQEVFIGSVFFSLLILTFIVIISHEISLARQNKLFTKKFPPLSQEQLQISMGILNEIGTVLENIDNNQINILAQNDIIIMPRINTIIEKIKKEKFLNSFLLFNLETKQEDNKKQLNFHVQRLNQQNLILQDRLDIQQNIQKKNLQINCLNRIIAEIKE